MIIAYFVAYQGSFGRYPIVGHLSTQSMDGMYMNAPRAHESLISLYGKLAWRFTRLLGALNQVFRSYAISLIVCIK